MEIGDIQKQALDALDQTTSSEDLEKIRIEYLGKKGKIAQLTQKIPHLPQEQRAGFGKEVNRIKKEIEKALKKKKKILQQAAGEEDWIDVTLPGIKPPQGHLHLLTQAIEEISSIFEKIGFERVRYPEVEWDYYAFEALNMPKDHFARDEMETFFVTPEIVLTPHTSSGQVREMEKGKLPIRMTNIARCDRRQADISHNPTFFQFEGLVVDKEISITHLKGVTDYFAKQFYGPDRTIRLRPYDFRFTEPSFEVDVTCGLCLGKGCRMCKSGWMELGGAGMVHPKVLEAGGVNPKRYSGFAFGWGVERTYMMRANVNIPDIRMLYKNDLRLLEQF